MRRLVEITDCERKERQNRTAFAGLIASPAVGAFKLPANARLTFRSVAGCAAGTTAATVGAHTIKTPLLAAGAKTRLQYAERGRTVTPAHGFEVYLDNGLGRYVKIAAGA